MELSLSVNGRPTTLDVDDAESLLSVLRDRLFLTGTKEGCTEGECGACTVLIDGIPVDSCIYAAVGAAGRQVETIEGLSDDEVGQAIQRAFVAAGGVQCGFCTPGFVATLTALVRQAQQPLSDADVREALIGNICRCTGYSQILDAVSRAVAEKESS